MKAKHHHYLWTQARRGRVSRAEDQLDLAPQTISGQLRELENEVGTALSRPSGRGLEQTDAGRMALSYDDQILHLAFEMQYFIGVGQSHPSGISQFKTAA